VHGVSGFAAWVAAHRLRRVVFIAGLFPLPFTGLISAALMVLSAELKGSREATIDCLGAIGLLALMLLVTGGPQALVLLIFAGASWGVALMLGLLVARYRSLTLAVQVAVMLVMVGLLLGMLLVDDLVSYWAAMIEPVVVDINQQGLAVIDTAAKDAIAEIMTGVVAFSILASTVISLMLGTWWVCRIRSEDFAGMFRQIRMGYVIGVLAALAGIAAWLEVEPLATNLLLLFAGGFVFHGLSVLHWYAWSKRWPRAWWLVIYMTPLLSSVLATYELVLLAALGFVDNWYDLRPEQRQDMV
jgi:hypothetical protein